MDSFFAKLIFIAKNGVLFDVRRWEIIFKLREHRTENKNSIFSYKYSFQRTIIQYFLLLLSRFANHAKKVDSLRLVKTIMYHL